jgi:hypothetical protein
MGFLDRFSGPLLSALRIMSALLFMAHGTSKLLQFPPREEMSSGPEPMTLIWFAGVLELVGGALLALGLLTRPDALLLSGTGAEGERGPGHPHAWFRQRVHRQGPRERRAGVRRGRRLLEAGP